MVLGVFDRRRGEMGAGLGACGGRASSKGWAMVVISCRWVSDGIVGLGDGVVAECRRAGAGHEYRKEGFRIYKIWSLLVTHRCPNLFEREKLFQKLALLVHWSMYLVDILETAL